MAVSSTVKLETMNSELGIASGAAKELIDSLEMQPHYKP
jgi:hypothetical protein